MNIIVCTKFIQGELNPFDATALECALEAADERPGEVQITVLGMGPLSWLEPMKRLTRLGKPGAFRAVLLSDPAFAGSDTLATSRILSSAIRKLGNTRNESGNQEKSGKQKETEKQKKPGNQKEPGKQKETEDIKDVLFYADWILCGRQTLDGDTAQIGPELAALLHLELAANVMERPQFHAASETLMTRLGTETVSRPAVLTLERIRDLRFPSLRSRPGEVEIWNREKVGIQPELCGTAGSPTRVLKTFTAEHGRRKCRFISWEQLFPLLAELRERPKSGLKITESEQKLPVVHIVGREVESQARAIAEKVLFVDKNQSPYELAEALQEAQAVLWNADLWGRRTAPQTAALLGTGLCADCTALETDGKTLFMYRPARSGDIIAKIICETRPQMATVRTSAGLCADVIVAGGRGVSENWKELLSFAESLGAEPAASRALVDTGKVSYEFQVGLTGKTVSPKIYIAVGISGAIQHLCAVENADVLIAVNPDRNARIFEYADYGIVKEFPVQ